MEDKKKSVLFAFNAICIIVILVAASCREDVEWCPVDFRSIIISAAIACGFVNGMITFLEVLEDHE